MSATEKKVHFKPDKHDEFVTSLSVLCSKCCFPVLTAYRHILLWCEPDFCKPDFNHPLPSCSTHTRKNITGNPSADPSLSLPFVCLCSVASDAYADKDKWGEPYISSTRNTQQGLPCQLHSQVGGDGKQPPSGVRWRKKRSVLYKCCMCAIIIGNGGDGKQAPEFYTA